MAGLPSGLEAYLADSDWHWYTGYQKKFKANWKDLLNIQHEGYHASHVHGKTLGMYFKPEDCANTLFEDSPGACSRLTVQRPLASEDLLSKMTVIQHLAMNHGTTSNWVDQDTSVAAKQVRDSVNLNGSNRWVFDCYTNAEFSDIKKFYDAVVPRLEEIIEFLNQYPVDDIPGEFRPLAYMALAACEVDDPVNIWQSSELTHQSNAKDWRVKQSFYDYVSENK